MITLRPLAMCGVAALAALSLTGCGSTRELQHKDVEIAELKQQIRELEAQLAKRDTQAVNSTAQGEGTKSLSDDEGVGVSETEEGTVVTLASDVFFRSGSNEINAAAKSALNRVVAIIEKEKKYAGKKIRVDGHTDSDPIRRSKWKDNQELSEARADSVKTYLVGRGIADSRVKTVGHADSKPVGKDKAKNRRVEIVILK